MTVQKEPVMSQTIFQVVTFDKITDEIFRYGRKWWTKDHSLPNYCVTVDEWGSFNPKCYKPRLFSASDYVGLPKQIALTPL